MNLQYMILLYCRNTLKTLSCFWGPLLYPEAVAKLLIYLGTCDLPNYEWYKGKELIDKLLQSDIDQEFKGKLKELIIQLRLR